MKRALMLALALLASPVLQAGPAPKVARNPAAAEGVALNFVVDGERAVLLNFTESALLISRTCQKADGKLSCKAYEAFQRFCILELKSGDPAKQARHMCKMTGGRIAKGLGARDTENDFCRFEDGSLLDLAPCSTRRIDKIMSARITALPLKIARGLRHRFRSRVFDLARRLVLGCALEELKESQARVPGSASAQAVSRIFVPWKGRTGTPRLRSFHCSKGGWLKEICFIWRSPRFARAPCATGPCSMPGSPWAGWKSLRPS